MQTNIMVIHNGPAVQQMFVNMLCPLGYKVLAVSNADEAVAMLEKRNVETVFIETRLAGEKTQDLCDRLMSITNDVRFIVIADNEDERLVYQSLQSGVFACLVRPFSLDSVMDITEAAHIDALRAKRAARAA